MAIPEVRAAAASSHPPIEVQLTNATTYEFKLTDCEYAELVEYRLRETGLQQELKRLRDSQKRLNAAWETIGLLTKSIAESSKLDLDGEVVEMGCFSCVRVLGLLHSCHSTLNPENVPLSGLLPVKPPESPLAA